MRQAYRPVGTRLRKAAATEDGGDVRLGAVNDRDRHGRACPGHLDKAGKAVRP